MLRCQVHQEEKVVSAEALFGFAREALAKLGLPEADAQLGAECLLWANLRGVDSHGVNRLLWVVDMAESGQLNPLPEIRVLRETPAVGLIDGDRGFGAVTATCEEQGACSGVRGVVMPV